jgi:cysteine-rich repeat protein
MGNNMHDSATRITGAAALFAALVCVLIGPSGCTTGFSKSKDDEECANGRLDDGESCDDANTQNGDGCDESCTVEAGFECFGQPSNCSTICGDGVVAGTETCDDEGLTGGDGCSAVCLVEPGWNCQGEPSGCAPICGDNLLVGEETCDGTLLSAWSCADLGLGDGSVSCLPDCTLDLSNCETQAECGNDVVEYPEACDGSDLDGETCQTAGYQSGTLACLPGCDGYDTSGCTGYCGDDMVSGNEVCDGADLGGETCASQGFSGGTLACRTDCSAYDFTGCEGGSCGDGVVGAGEACDGANLAGHTCQSFGYYGGQLACQADCMDFVLSGCQGQCGDGAVNGGEACDGDALAGETCVSRGFDTGTLACAADCMAFDTSGCSHSCALDCSSPGCEGQPCDDHGFICENSSCTCSGNGGPAETNESLCGDDRDNDCDGQTDCADSSCNGDPCGLHGRVCANESCVCSGNGGGAEAAEQTCGDNSDNDCDGQTDCADADCAGKICAAHGHICSSGTCICPGGVENTKPLCTDGIDNDCDGLTDGDDLDCCGLHALPPCPTTGCNDGLQLCDPPYDLCYYCCGDGSENGICGTWSDNTPCSPDPDHQRFDADCCGGHGQVPCGTQGCDMYFQQCDPPYDQCWHCCGDETNNECGWWNETTPCSSDPSDQHYDADC